MGLWNRITGAADRDQFIAEAVARIRNLVGEAQYEETSFSVKGGGHTVFLATFWSQYQQAKARDRDQVLDRVEAYTRDMEPSTPTFEEARGRLRPMVHDRIYWSASRLKLEAAGIDPADALPDLRPFGAHLVLSIVLDLPTAMRSVTAGERAEWGRDFDALLAEAKQNIVRTSRVR